LAPCNARQSTSLPAILRSAAVPRNPTTTSCSAFRLTPKPLRRRIPAIAVHLAAQWSPRNGEGGHRRTRACNIFPAGPYNASTKTVLPADTGSAPTFPAPMPASNSAQAAAARSRPFRRRSVRVSACARAPSPRARPCAPVRVNFVEPIANLFRFGNYADVIRPLGLLFFFFLTVEPSLSPAYSAQSAPAPNPPQATTQASKVTYENSENGLRQLANDILKAQKENNPSRAQELLNTFVLPNFREWYADNFSDVAASRVVPAYAAGGQALPIQLAGIFLGALKEGFKNVEVVRYVDDRDACTKAGSKVFSGLTARKTRVPLYELRFAHGDLFKSVFAFAYVDGAFRIVLTPDYSSHATETPAQPGKSPAQLAVGANVQAARLVCRVTPYYPEEARHLRVSGTVKIHAIIGKDGSVSQLDAISGPPELVTASLQAVRLWRYRPTMLNNEPVEVDTTIDVIFALSN